MSPFEFERAAKNGLRAVGALNLVTEQALAVMVRRYWSMWVIRQQMQMSPWRQRKYDLEMARLLRNAPSPEFGIIDSGPGQFSFSLFPLK